MRSVTRLGAGMMAAALAVAAIGAMVVPEREAADAPPVLIDGVPAELYMSMQESVCGKFDLSAPQDPTAFAGYEAPVRVVEVTLPDRQRPSLTLQFGAVALLAVVTPILAGQLLRLDADAHPA